MQVAAMAPLFISLAITAVRFKNRQTHQRFMAMGHILIGVNFLPRVWMIGLRLILPFLANDTNFSIACLFAWYNQINAIQRLTALRLPLATANVIVAASSVGLLVLEYELGFPHISSLAGPVFSLVAGNMIYLRMIHKDTVEVDDNDRKKTK
eukprot:6234896-Prymnesium_polylepis.1